MGGAALFVHFVLSVCPLSETDIMPQPTAIQMKCLIKSLPSSQYPLTMFQSDHIRFTAQRNVPSLLNSNASVALEMLCKYVYVPTLFVDVLAMLTGQYLCQGNAFTGCVFTRMRLPLCRL